MIKEIVIDNVPYPNYYMKEGNMEVYSRKLGRTCVQKQGCVEICNRTLNKKKKPSVKLLYHSMFGYLKKPELTDIPNHDGYAMNKQTKEVYSYHTYQYLTLHSDNCYQLKDNVTKSVKHLYYITFENTHKNMDKIVGYDDYYINKNGDVFGMNEHIFLNRQLVRDYESYRLYKDSVGHTEYVHCLMAKQYIPNPNNLPTVDHIRCVECEKKNENTLCIHKEKNLNNSLSNLRWCSHSEQVLNQIPQTNTGYKYISERENGKYRLRIRNIETNEKPLIDEQFESLFQAVKRYNEFVTTLNNEFYLKQEYIKPVIRLKNK